MTIYNYQTNLVLNVHCKSRDDGLRERVLDKQAQFNWSFKMNFWRTTLFWCRFNGLNGHASFEDFGPGTSIGFLHGVTLKTAFGQRLMIDFT